MSFNAWVLLVGCGASLALVLAGAMVVLRAVRRTRVRIAQLPIAMLRDDAQRLTLGAARISKSVAAMNQLALDARASVARFGEAAEMLRLREAVTALRIAGAAMHLLAGFR